MVVPRIQRAPRVKLRIIFLSRPARKERERDMRSHRTSRIVTQPEPVRISRELEPMLAERLNYNVS